MPANPLKSLYEMRRAERAMEDMLEAGLSRREILRRGALFGAGAVVGPGLLAACGDDDDGGSGGSGGGGGGSSDELNVLCGCSRIKMAILNFCLLTDSRLITSKRIRASLPHRAHFPARGIEIHHHRWRRRAFPEGVKRPPVFRRTRILLVFLAARKLFPKARRLPGLH